MALRITLALSFGFALFASDASAATFVVTTTADSGPGSLRDAITQANASRGADDIVFQIAGPAESGVYRIRPATPLPRLLGAQVSPFNYGDGTRILGETQRAFSGDTNPLGPEIVLDGSNAGVNAVGLDVSAAGCVIREITIQKFDLFGIQLSGASNKVEGCYVGTGASGEAANAGNGWAGIAARGADVVIGGSTIAARNVISGNGARSGSGSGVLVEPPAGVTIEGNYIGIDATGLKPIPNVETGINIAAPGSVVRGNVISGHASAGVKVLGAGSSTSIEGNLVGTNAEGLAAIPNGQGVLVQGDSSTIKPESVVIGGVTATSRNILSGNLYSGLSITGQARNSMVRGNYIGTDITGMNALPNGRGGVVISRGSNHVIGGAVVGARNVISGNAEAGLTFDTGAFNNVAQGNYIGVAADGVKPLGNTSSGFREGNGISVGGGSAPEAHGTGNRIGGADAGAGNVIAHNEGRGVIVYSTENSVLRNSIYANGSEYHDGIGIDLENDGLTPNDPGDVDGSSDGSYQPANHFQNHPVLASVEFRDGNVTVAGTLDSKPNKNFRVELFATNPQASRGYSEGQTFLGVANVATDASGRASFHVTLPIASPDQIITATATDALGNTSEFGGLVDRLLNISTRGRVESGEHALIAGLIVTGQTDKRIMLRGIGPSLTDSVGDALQDPVLELYQGDSLLASNDNWRDSQAAEIQASGLAPTNSAESAMIRTVSPGIYTAILRDRRNTSGVALIEAYDLAADAGSQQANISTRGLIGSGDDVMIAGFIIGGQSHRGSMVAVRAIGPSLATAGVNDAISDPVLQVVDASGTIVASNDDWKNGQRAEMVAYSLAPSDDRESAILVSLPAGDYTAVVRGAADTTGVGLVEVYNLNQ